MVVHLKRFLYLIYWAYVMENLIVFVSMRFVCQCKCLHFAIINQWQMVPLRIVEPLCDLTLSFPLFFSLFLLVGSLKGKDDSATKSAKGRRVQFSNEGYHYSSSIFILLLCRVWKCYNFSEMLELKSVWHWSGLQLVAPFPYLNDVLLVYYRVYWFLI